MATDRYIAALEISSSKVIGAVGAIGADGAVRKSGQLEILAVEQEKTTDSVRYGQIQNIEETSIYINRVLERLERRHNINPRVITGVVVGISGRSLKNIEKDVDMALPDDTQITDAILDRLKSKAMEADIDSSLEIVDAIPRLFTVGRTETDRPKGMIGNRIAAVYDLIVARPVILKNLRLVICDKLGLDLKGVVITPVATADLVLNEHEKKLGCMLLDIGAETTNVTIYTSGNLVYYATLPMGGRNITLDLKALNVIESKAEELKCTIGNAIAPDVPSPDMIGAIKISRISDYVVARAEEIATNIVEQVRYAGLSDKDIPEGIVICGGGARLNGMVDLIAKFSGLKVRTATLPDSIRISDHNASGMETLQLSAIMWEAARMPDVECLEIPSEPEPEPVHEETVETVAEHEQEKPAKRKKGKGFFSAFAEKLGTIFTPIGDDDEGEELS